MAETKFPKRRAFAMQKPRKSDSDEQPRRRRTERQRAADQRHREEARLNAPQKGPKTPEKRMTAAEPGKVRITGLIADELTRALNVILKLDGPSDVLMKLFFRSNPKLGMRERSLIAEGIYYALRHYASLRWSMRPIRPDSAPRLAALVTLARQHGIESMSPRTIGNEDGPLRNILKADLSKAPAHVRAEVPQWLYDLIQAQYDDADKLYAALLESAPLDLRVNILKTDRDTVIEEIAKNGVYAEPTPYSPEGVRLDTKPGLTHWPIFKEGKIDVQDEGSQLIARLVAPRRRDMICDFCAGAGGKTLAMGALMRSRGRLYACDVNEKRLAGLTPRMRRAGLSNVHPMVIRSESDVRVKRLNGKFDRVLVDAPCTGTGTFRRNPDLKWRLSPEELARINDTQKSVLEHASRLVKLGGRLVYATCSLLRRENQDVIEAFMAEHPEWRLLSATEVLRSQNIDIDPENTGRFGQYFQMLPHENNTDGFFAAVLELPDLAKEEAARERAKAIAEARARRAAEAEAEAAALENGETVEGAEAVEPAVEATEVVETVETADVVETTQTSETPETPDVK